MATFKIIVFHKQKRKDGKCPVRIRVTWQRKQEYISTEYYLAEKEGFVIKKYTDEKGEKREDVIIKDNFVQEQLYSRIKQYENLKKERIGQKIYNYTAKELCEYFVKNTGVKNNGEIDFINFCQNLIDSILVKKKDVGISEGTAKLYQTVLNSLIEYSKGKLYTSDITSSFLKSYIDWLKEKDSGRGANRKKAPGKKEKITGSGINLYLRTLRALFNKAKLHYNDEDKGDIKIPHNPFKKTPVPQVPVVEKRAIEIDKIKAIRDYVGVEKRDTLARDVFMLSFYLIGINAVDLYNLKKYSKGRIEYERTKTKNRRQDKAFMSVKVEPEALEIIEKYSALRSTLYAFKFREMYANDEGFNKAVNKGLKKIGKKIGVPDLDFYTARHSWATIAVNDCKIDEYKVGKYLNHAPEQRMKVTEGYIKVDRTPQDEANRKVLDLLK